MPFKKYLQSVLENELGKMTKYFILFKNLKTALLYINTAKIFIINTLY